MNPGDLKQRLTFQTPAGGTDADGFPITEPVVYKQVRGALKTLKGQTRYIAAQSQMEHNREFTIRYQRALDDVNRPQGLTVMWNKKEHKLESIENDDGLNISMTVVVSAVS